MRASVLVAPKAQNMQARQSGTHLLDQRAHTRLILLCCPHLRRRRLSRPARRLAQHRPLHRVWRRAVDVGSHGRHHPLQLVGRLLQPRPQRRHAVGSLQQPLLQLLRLRRQRDGGRRLRRRRRLAAVAVHRLRLLPALALPRCRLLRRLRGRSSPVSQLLLREAWQASQPARHAPYAPPQMHTLNDPDGCPLETLKTNDLPATQPPPCFVSLHVSAPKLIHYFRSPLPRPLGRFSTAAPQKHFVFPPCCPRGEAQSFVVTVHSRNIDRLL